MSHAEYDCYIYARNYGARNDEDRRRQMLFDELSQRDFKDRELVKYCYLNRAESTIAAFTPCRVASISDFSTIETLKSFTKERHERFVYFWQTNKEIAAYCNMQQPNRKKVSECEEYVGKAK
mgnify:CR=1 FL=1